MSFQVRWFLCSVCTFSGKYFNFEFHSIMHVEACINKPLLVGILSLTAADTRYWKSLEWYIPQGPARGPQALTEKIFFPPFPLPMLGKGERRGQLLERRKLILPCTDLPPSFHQVRSFLSFPLHPSPVVQAYAWCLKGECKSQTSDKPELLLQPLFNSVFDVRVVPCSVPSAPSFGAAKPCWASILNIPNYVRLLNHWCGKSHSHLSIANGREKDWFFHGPAAPKGNITDSQKWGVTRTH